MDDVWLSNPSKLFENLGIFPQAEMTDGERVNAFTRLIIIVALILFMAYPKSDAGLSVIILGLGLVFLLTLVYPYVSKSSGFLS